MDKSKFLLPLFAIFTVSCDNQDDKKTCLVPVQDSVSFVVDEKQQKIEGFDFISSEGLDVNDEFVFIYDENGDRVPLADEKLAEVPINTEDEIKNAGLYEYAVSDDNAAKMRQNLKLSGISVSDSKGNLYEIVVSHDATFFEVKVNAKKVLKSKDLSAKKLKDIQPVMKEVLEDILQISKDEKELVEVSPKTVWGRFSAKEENHHIIKRTRLGIRIEKMQNNIIENVVKALEMQQQTKSNNGQEIQDPAPIKIMSDAQKKLSATRLMQNEAHQKG